MADHTTHYTTDHEKIRRWAEARDGRPAKVQETGDGQDPGILRIDFPDYSGEQELEETDWDTWFEKFDQTGLAFVYQEETKGGDKSNFNKLVDRKNVEDQLETEGRTR